MRPKKSEGVGGIFGGLIFNSATPQELPDCTHSKAKGMKTMQIWYEKRNALSEREPTALIQHGPKGGRVFVSGGEGVQ